MLSHTADYALGAVLMLGRARGGRPLRAAEIAAAIGAPANYMSKTLNALARAGIVASRRGPTGGFVLALDPAELTVASIVDLFSETRPLVRCLLEDRACDPSRPCAAHRRWSTILAARREPLTRTTIADLLSGATAAPLPSTPLLP